MMGIVILMVLCTILLLSGCSSTKQELVTTQADLMQARKDLVTVQAEANARQTEIPQLRQQIATAEAQTKAQQDEIASLNQKLVDAKVEIQAKESARAATDKQLAATQAELDDVKFAAERLQAQTEAALQKEDLKEAQRVADLLADKHPGTKEAKRAAEIVTLIEKAIANKAAAEQARIVAATGKMKAKTDDIRAVTFYKDKTTADASLSSQFHTYIGQKDKRVWLRLFIQFYGKEWLFVRSFTVKAGSQVYDITPRYDEFERDNSAYSVWEWYDGAVTSKEIQIIKAVIAADKPVVRFNGQTYYSDYTITAAEQKALQNVLDVFVALGGDLDSP
jgi:PBP1b-binding outer membrane lipoprotein LpoB